MRFYDLSLGNDLDDSGERYCHSTGPDFSYNSEIQVLFRSNLDPVVSTGFECEVVAQPVEFEAQPALPTITNPPPRVSSFAQEACTDITVSGGHNDRKNVIIQFRTQHPHLYFKHVQVLTDATFPRWYKHEPSSASSWGGSSIHLTRL